MMTLHDEIDEMDSDIMETLVSVHSPVIKSNHKGGNYISYAISLKSNNSCFTQQFSCIRRRYSEFVHLRSLLKAHHPNIEPPALPRKSIFGHFNQTFINDRAEGLQNFLRGVVDVPVYLSNKGVHLFLQSHCSMSEIDKQVCGEVPAPRLMSSVCQNTCPMISRNNTSSKLVESMSSSGSLDREFSVDTETPSIQTAAIQCSCSETSSSADSSPNSPRKSSPVPILQAYHRQTIDERTDTCAHSTSSNSSCDSLGNFDPIHSTGRRVSFNEKVKVAIVRNQLWNIATRPIKAGAC